MPVLPPRHSPRAAFADLRNFIRHRGKEQWKAAALALFATAVILVIFFYDAKVNTAPPPQVIYVEDFPSNRTDAEIIADAEKRQAEKEARAKARQEQFKELENSFGID